MDLRTMPDSQARLITPFEWKDPRTFTPIGMTAEPIFEEIDPEIFKIVRQAIAAREIVEAGIAPASEPGNDNEDGTTSEPAFALTPYIPQDPTKLPRRDWLFAQHYIRKYVSVTVSPGGLGKTSNSVVEALAMVSGRPLLSCDGDGGLSNRLRVALFNGEDPRDEMERRIEAARLHYKLKREDVAGLFLDVGREQELVLMEETRRGVDPRQPIVEAVVEHIMANGIDAMIVDPFVSSHRVNENDNGAIDRVAKLWGQIADRTNCAIELVHHLRKLNENKEATIDDARGAVALIGAARSVRLLNRMSPEQAKEAGVPPHDTSSHFYVITGKANMTKQDNRRAWRKLESVGLGNGDGLTRPQDHVGVVTPWNWPSKAETAATAAGAVTPEQMELILVRLENQTWKPGRTSGTNWAGNLVMDVLGLDASEKENRVQADKIIAGWRADGTLAVEEEQNPANRHKWHVLRPTRPSPSWVRQLPR
ncbi:AAA family ATPase [Bradyrhizobium sp. 17]|nr:AAA family ATPase [Bradyrhizobium sp. 17]